MYIFEWRFFLKNIFFNQILFVSFCTCLFPEEADEDIQKRNEQRGLSDNDGKQTKQSPSSLMLQIEEGLDTISEFVSDGVDR